MIFLPLRKAIALILVAAVTAMSLAAATARGQVSVAGQVVVLCSGGGLVQVTLDADGNPTGESHFCPDLVASVLAVHVPAAPELERPVIRTVKVVVSYGVPSTFHAPPVSRARAPPVSA